MTTRFHGLRPLAPGRRSDSERGGRDALAGIAHFARVLDGHRETLDSTLPAELRGHWRLARLDEAELVAVAENSAWAFRLRYLGARLQKACQQHLGAQPARVTVRVAPLAERPRRQSPPTAPGPQAIAAIESAARSADNPALQKALGRLARHYRGGTSEGSDG